MAEQSFKIGLSNADKDAMRDDIAQDTLEKVVNGQVQIGDETTNLTEKIDEINRAVATVDNKAEIDGYYEGMGVGEADTAKQLMSTIHNEDSTPFAFRTSGGTKSIGDRVQIEYIEGGTWKWNQFFANNPSTHSATGTSVITNTYFTAIKGHKYLLSTSGPILFYGLIKYDDFSSGVHSSPKNNIIVEWTFDNHTVNPWVYTVDSVSSTQNYFITDLTDIFGAGNEPTDVNSPAVQAIIEYAKTHPEYDAGSLKSVSVKGKKYVGFNQWDEQIIPSGYILDDGTVAEGYGTRFASKNFIRVVGGAEYYFALPYGIGNGVRIAYYDGNKNLLNVSDQYFMPFSMPKEAQYIKFCVHTSYGSQTYKNDICISFSWNGSLNGQYLPYEVKSYVIGNPMTGTELRGVVKNVDGNLVYDGDRYYPDGKIERRYGIVDLGTLDWSRTEYGVFVAIQQHKAKENTQKIVCKRYVFDYGINIYNNVNDKVIGVAPSFFSDDLKLIAIRDSSYVDTVSFKQAMSGVVLVYELETPTEETSVRYQELQDIDDWGTEEFIGSEIPVGHKSNYFPNLRDKVQNLPNNASQDGIYVVKQEGSQQSLAPTSEITAPLVESDNAMKQALGGTLRQLLAASKNIDFNNTDYVDLGELNWTLYSGFFYAEIPNLKRQSSTSAVDFMPNSKYKTMSYDDVYYKRGNGISYYVYQNRVAIYDSNAGTDANAFKNSLKGVLLAYEKGE